MPDNVKFYEWQCHDDRPGICQETAIQRVLAFAGIHNHLKLAEISENFNGGALSEWEDAEGTWILAAGALDATGGGAAQWYKYRHVEELEIGFIVSFNKTGDRGAFLFCCDDSYAGHMVYWTATDIAIADVDGDTVTDRSVLPVDETGDATVTVMVWPRQYTSIDTVDDLMVAVWFDAKLLLVHAFAYEEHGKKIGFGVYYNDNITFDNLRVPQLHQIVEWTSVDPGELASSGLGRIISYEKIRVQARYDASVKIWRNEASVVDWAVPEGRAGSVNVSEMVYSPSHYRLVGAMHEADTFRYGTQGHIFDVGQDPNALTMDETQARGTRRHREVEEQAKSLELSMPPNPVAEVEDIITYDTDTWRTQTITYRIVGGEEGAYVLASGLNAREYLS